MHTRTRRPWCRPCPLVPTCTCRLLLQALHSLRLSLRGLGSTLLFRCASPETALPELVAAVAAAVPVGGMWR